MEKKKAIVTGASSGFGLLTAIQLAKQGFDVVATYRSKDKVAELVTLVKEQGVRGNIEIFELDVALDSSIESFREFLGKLKRVDVLVNNAGFAGAGFVEEIPIREYRSQFDTNVFGVIAVTQAVLPYMRKQIGGKIINVSSISGKIGFPGLSPYIASKHALEGWSESLRLEVKPFGIDVVLIEPGSYQTNIWTSGKRITEQSLQEQSPYFKTMNLLQSYIEKGSNQYGNPIDVANLIVKVTQQNKTKLRYPIGKGVKAMIVMKNLLPWRLWETILLKQLHKSENKA